MRLATAGLCAVVLAASMGQGSQLSRTAPRRPVAVTGEEGLVFRLSEGAEAPERRQPPAPGAPLDDAAAQRVLDRLPPLRPAAADEEPFAFRPRSQPPPRAGVTVAQPFPPPAAPAGGPPQTSGAPVTVLRRSPEGDVPLASHLSVTFSQPMVPVGAHEDLAAAGVPVRLAPQPEGKWRWVGTRTLLFEPALRFPMATEYRVEVPAGTRPATGAPSSRGGAVDLHHAAAHDRGQAPRGRHRAARGADLRRLRPGHRSRGDGPLRARDRRPGAAGDPPRHRAGGGGGRGREAAGGEGRPGTVARLPRRAAAAAGHGGDGGDRPRRSVRRGSAGDYRSRRAGVSGPSARSASSATSAPGAGASARPARPGRSS